jgi:uncharacterized protein with HEPN domain
MSRRYPELVLDDMLDCINTVLGFTANMTVDDIMSSRLHRDALIRNLEVLGEAANHLTKEVHQLAPDIPWPKLISFRNRLIHEYHGVNWKIIIPIVLQDLPLLKQQLEALYPLVPASVNYIKETEA